MTPRRSVVIMLALPGCRGPSAPEPVTPSQLSPDELSREEARHVLGAQGNVWTDTAFATGFPTGWNCRLTKRGLDEQRAEWAPTRARAEFRVFRHGARTAALGLGTA